MSELAPIEITGASPFASPLNRERPVGIWDEETALIRSVMGPTETYISEPKTLDELDTHIEQQARIQAEKQKAGLFEARSNAEAAVIQARQNLISDFNAKQAEIVQQRDGLSMSFAQARASLLDGEGSQKWLMLAAVGLAAYFIFRRK